MIETILNPRAPHLMMSWCILSAINMNCIAFEMSLATVEVFSLLTNLMFVLWILVEIYKSTLKKN